VQSQRGLLKEGSNRLQKSGVIREHGRTFRETGVDSEETYTMHRTEHGFIEGLERWVAEGRQGESGIRARGELKPISENDRVIQVAYARGGLRSYRHGRHCGVMPTNVKNKKKKGTARQVGKAG